jgi:UDP-N-acetyl-2-amino-2-deoxyglucuronate dehydrogenase
VSARPLRVAVIGCGDISSVHLAAIAGSPEADLVAVCDVDDGRLAEASTRWGVPGFTDVDELVDRVHPDVAHVCTPHSTHAPIAMQLLARGVDVLLEKPVAHSDAAAQRLSEAAARSDAILGVCFQNRYNAPVEAAKRLMEAGAIGEIRGAAATVFWHRDEAYYRARPWRGRWETGGGGMLMNQAIHTVDLLQWLLGDVTAVAGAASTRMLGDVMEVEDTADMVLTHSGGARSTLFATLSHVSNLPVTIEIEGVEGSLTLRGDLTARLPRRDEIVRERRSSGQDARSYWGVSHELLIADFYRAVRARRPFWIDVEEARKSLAIIQNVYAQHPRTG